jgi:type IV fimbrial biogenesis protein FimT
MRLASSDLFAPGNADVLRSRASAKKTLCYAQPAHTPHSDQRRMMPIAISNERFKATLAERDDSDRRTPGRPHLARGFTLIELCATLSILAILAGIAAASMSSTLTNNRLYAAQDEFVAYLTFARSEAVRRGVPVVVGASAPVTGNAFGSGWNVWVDDNGNNVYDAGETLLRSHEALPSNIAIGDGAISTITFTPMGFLAPSASVDVKVCPTDPALGGFDITIQPNGLTDVADVAGHMAPCNG